MIYKIVIVFLLLKEKYAKNLEDIEKHHVDTDTE